MTMWSLWRSWTTWNQKWFQHQKCFLRRSRHGRNRWKVHSACQNSSTSGSSSGSTSGSGLVVVVVVVVVAAAAATVQFIQYCISCLWIIKNYRYSHHNIYLHHSSLPRGRTIDICVKWLVQEFHWLAIKETWFILVFIGAIVYISCHFINNWLN